jgi:hypothetical protein
LRPPRKGSRMYPHGTEEVSSGKERKGLLWRRNEKVLTHSTKVVLGVSLYLKNTVSADSENTGVSLQMNQRGDGRRQYKVCVTILRRKAGLSIACP